MTITNLIHHILNTLKTLTRNITCPKFSCLFLCLCLCAAMAELDLSLSDALTDSVPQPGPESLVERDFVAQLEAEAFDDQVGETVGKTDFIPLLDNDDTRAGESDMMERSGAWVSVLIVSTVYKREGGDVGVLYYSR